ncbi:MAG: hypothetical protein ACFB9M_05830 [Myxococcota bacterium]
MTPHEFIVAFKEGTSEGAARAIISRFGGRVRRRMRTDRPEQVQLLAQFPADESRRLAAESLVARFEVNHGGFRAL